MDQTREPSDSESSCPEHLCITRIWKKGVKEATLYFTREAEEDTQRDKQTKNIDDELEFEEMMEETSDDFGED